MAFMQYRNPSMNAKLLDINNRFLHECNPRKLHKPNGGWGYATLGIMPIASSMSYRPVTRIRLDALYTNAIPG